MPWNAVPRVPVPLCTILAVFLSSLLRVQPPVPLLSQSPERGSWPCECRRRVQHRFLEGCFDPFDALAWQEAEAGAVRRCLPASWSCRSGGGGSPCPACMQPTAWLCVARPGGAARGCGPWAGTVPPGPARARRRPAERGRRAAAAPLPPPPLGPHS